MCCFLCFHSIPRFVCVDRTNVYISHVACILCEIAAIFSLASYLHRGGTSIPAPRTLTIVPRLPPVRFNHAVYPAPSHSMCGVGTIPFLGSSWFPNVFLFGGEVDDNAIDHLRRNSRSATQSATGPARATGAAAACAWDAQCLPLRDSSVDAMVVDM